MLGLLVPAVLPVLIQEGAKLARRAMKERRKDRERQRSEELQALRTRIEKLEAEARWAR